jgi:hypothetical protein
MVGNLSFALLLALALIACGSRAARVVVEPAPAPAPKSAPQLHDPTSEPQPEPAQGTPEQDFVLSDEPAAEPAELLKAARHDCCDEASAAEVKAGVQDDGRPPAKHAPASPPSAAGH